MVKTKDDESIDPLELRSIIRDNHHQRSEAFILKHFLELGIEDSHQAEIIGRICRGHRKEDLHDTNLFNSDKKYKSFSINLSLLSMFLRISDEFDLSFNRTPEISYNNLELKEKFSKDEWGTHLSISGVSPQKDDPTVIVGSANCKSPIIHRKLKSIESKINDQLDELPDYLDQHWQLKKELPKKFRIDIESDGYQAFDFKFSLKEREIFHLLMGEKLYSRKEESLRELLKNSIDACHSRLATLKKLGLSFIPSIEFQISSDGNLLIISDNGLGMDDEIIESYFTKIGKSFYKSKEFFDQDLKFTPESELGIGILSAFMIADKIIIETKKEGKSALRIEIDDISDYFFVTDSTKSNTGTIMTLHLKENSKKINFLDEIKKFACHIDIKINFQSSSGEIVTILDSDFKNYYINVLPRDFPSLKLIGIEINENNIEGMIGFLVDVDENQSITCSEDMANHDLYKNLYLKWKNQISFEGIFINDKKIISSWLRPTFFDINLKNNSIDLNVARNDFVANEKFDNTLKFLDDISAIKMNDIIVKEFAEIETKEKKKVVKQFFNKFTDWHYYVDDRSKPQSNPKIIELLKKYYYFEAISKNGEELFNYYEIKNSPKKFYIPYNIYNSARLKELLLQIDSSFNDSFFIIYPETQISNIISLFDIVPRIDMFEILGIVRIPDAHNIFPKTWTIACFENYETTRFMEFSDWNTTIINVNNRFSKLLLTNENAIINDKTLLLALNGFFRNLKKQIKKDFSAFRANQIEIINWFVDMNIIPQESLETYLLNVDDFPPGFLK